MMDDYVSESDSDYTSYWRDWVSGRPLTFQMSKPLCFRPSGSRAMQLITGQHCDDSLGAPYQAVLHVNPFLL